MRWEREKKRTISCSIVLFKGTTAARSSSEVGNAHLGSKDGEKDEIEELEDAHSNQNHDNVGINDAKGEKKDGVNSKEDPVCDDPSLHIFTSTKFHTHRCADSSSDRSDNGETCYNNGSSFGAPFDDEEKWGDN